MPVTFDADFFWYLTLPHAEKLRKVVSEGAKNCVLTPNKVEFKRMAEFYLKEDLVDAKPVTTEPAVEKDISTNKVLKELCDRIKGATIIQKVPHRQLGREQTT